MKGSLIVGGGSCEQSSIRTKPRLKHQSPHQHGDQRADNGSDEWEQQASGIRPDTAQINRQQKLGDRQRRQRTADPGAGSGIRPPTKEVGHQKTEQQHHHGGAELTSEGNALTEEPAAPGERQNQTE